MRGLSNFENENEIDVLIDQLREYIEELSSFDLVQLNNSYYYESNNSFEIHENEDEFFSTYFDGRGKDLLRTFVQSGDDYNLNDEWVFVGSGDTFQSFSGYPGRFIDVDDIISFIIENNEDLNDDSIREILDSFVWV